MPSNLYGAVMHISLLLCLLLTLSSPTLAYAIDSASIEVGNSLGKDKTTHLKRVGMAWNWDKNWSVGNHWNLGGYWETSLGSWHTQEDHNVVDFGVTPVLRLIRNGSSGVTPYTEFGIGAHYLSDKTISDETRSGTHFQFGNHLGLGIRFGERERFDLSYRIQHLSNADIKSPNPGIDFNEIRLQLYF